MLMVMSMRESGKMIRHMALENICILMELSTKAIGKKTSNMVWVEKLGLMEHAMRDSMWKARRMVEANSSGLMGLLMMVSS
jgi:hypothetical protein